MERRMDGWATHPATGGALRIARWFPLVLETALGRMARCECGAETSCYGCLRNFRNQAFHEQLRRADALGFLERLVKLGTAGEEPPRARSG
jgi:hypothetical protein